MKEKKTVYKYSIWALSILSAILLTTTTYYYSQSKNLKINSENNYNRAFHELANYVNDIDTLLQKSMLTSGAEQMSTISSELFRQSAAAKACLGQLPVSEIQMENTEKFLSQVGDYTYLLSQNVIDNNKVTEEEYNTLSKLSDYAANLNSRLSKMESDLYDGTISFNDIKNKSRYYLDNSASAKGGDIVSDFETVEKEFQEYPSLIYDGPFSEHIENMKPAMCEKSKDISAQDAQKAALEFLKGKNVNLTYTGDSKNTVLDEYNFSSENDNIYIGISKKGGFPIYYLNTRNVSEEKLSFDDAILKASEFLSSHGYKSMKESYYEKSNNVATVNFAYVQGDTVCYSDLIKIKVALDNGEILGFEAHGYLMNHKHRNLEAPALSAQEAKNSVNSHLPVGEANKVLIPKDSRREVLCYEFKGQHKGRNFLVYINANTGKEEEILMLIESEDGILTV